VSEEAGYSGARGNRLGAGRVKITVDDGINMEEAKRRQSLVS